MVQTPTLFFLYQCVKSDEGSRETKFFMYQEEDSQKKEKKGIKFSKPASDNIILFLEDYVNHRFGSMNKNDFEVLIFNAILNSDLEETSNYKLSRILKIPESKVKRLKYEADLVYNEAGSDDQLRVLEQVLKKRDLKEQKGKYNYGWKTNQ